MRSEVIWPRPHTPGFQTECLHSSVVNTYGLSVPGVWYGSYPIIFCMFPMMQCLCYVEAILELDLPLWREATSIKPG